MKIFVFFLVIFAILLSILARRILKDSNDKLDEFYKNSSKKAPIHLRRYLQIEFIKINKAYEILKETYQSEKASSKS